MKNFDPGLDWAILATDDCPAAEELAKGLLHLRALCGLSPTRPEILDANGPAPAGDRPIFVLNCEMDHPAGPDGPPRGFSWRAGEGRIEFYGDSRHGLMNAIADFFDAIGLWWPEPGQAPRLAAGPAVANAPALPLERPGRYDDGAGERLCMAVPVALCARWGGRDNVRLGSEIIEWAARIGFDAVLVRTDARAQAFQAAPEQVWERIAPQLFETAERCGIALEAGGACMDKLVPRAPFRRHKDWYRMKEGKRLADHNFCPTTPAALAAVATNAVERIVRFGSVDSVHLHGSGNPQEDWCHCPSCRAFSPQEQELLALNAIADALDSAGLATVLALPEDRDESTDPGAIKPRERIRPRPVQVEVRELASWKSALAPAVAIGAASRGRSAPNTVKGTATA